MAGDFDPYYKWLGIPPKDQPPNHYRLLSIERFEADRQVIDAATNRVMGYLKALSTGGDLEYAQKLLNEVAAARKCLLNPDRKAAYDSELRTQGEGLAPSGAAEAEASIKPAPAVGAIPPPPPPPPPPPSPTPVPLAPRLVTPAPIPVVVPPDVGSGLPPTRTPVPLLTPRPIPPPTSAPSPVPIPSPLPASPSDALAMPVAQWATPAPIRATPRGETSGHRKEDRQPEKGGSEWGDHRGASTTPEWLRNPLVWAFVIGGVLVVVLGLALVLWPGH